MLRDPVADWRELSALYEQAEGLEGHELHAWLEGLKTESKHLIADLKRMLGAKARVEKEGFLETLPTLPHGSERPPAEWGEGSRIGAYRLVRHIGSGGMAEVWLAERVDGAFERKVAIKLLFNHPARSQRENFVQRFRRERDILASLHHPNIAALHDAGVTAEGQPWLALEYVSGESITTWSDNHRLSIEQRVELFLQMVMAVESAHAQLVVHRDLKPSNVLVTADRRVKLLDFGIAKLVGPDGWAPDTELTRAGGHPLTLQYASPEQILGNALTTASDQYSLGAMLYELLCGARPYDLSAASPADVERTVLQGTLVAPSRRARLPAAALSRSLSPDALQRKLAGDLDAIVLKAMSVETSHRYTSLDAFRQDLERWRDGKPVRAKSSSAGYRIGKFVRRHRMAVAAGTLSVLALTVATAISLVMAHRASQEAGRALAARDFMIRTFKSADPEKLEGPEPTARQLLETATERAGEDLRGQPELLASVLGSLGQMQINLNLLTAAEKTYSRLSALELAQGRKRPWVSAQIQVALVAFMAGGYERAKAAIEATTDAAAAFGDDHELQARLHFVNGLAYRGLRDLGKAAEQMEVSLEHSRKAYGPADVRTLDAVKGLAEVQGELRRYDEALFVLDAATTQTARGPGSETEYLGISIIRANLLARAGRYEASRDALERASADCVRLAGRDHADCVIVLIARAFVLLRQGDCEKLTELIPALSRASVNASAAPSLRSYTLARHAQVAVACNPSLATPELRAGLEAVSKDSSRNGLEHALARLALAELGYVSGERRNAEHWLTEARQVISEPVVPPVQEGRAELLAAMMASDDGNIAEALSAYARAEKSFVDDLGSNHPLLAYLSLNKALILQRHGRRQEALDIFDAALPRLRSALGAATPNVQRVERIRFGWAQGQHQQTAATPTPPTPYFL